MSDDSIRDTIEALFKLREEVDKMLDENEEEIETLRKQAEALFGKMKQKNDPVDYTVEKEDNTYIVTLDFGKGVGEDDVRVDVVSDHLFAVDTGDAGIAIRLPRDIGPDGYEITTKNGIVTVKFHMVEP